MYRAYVLPTTCHAQEIYRIYIFFALYPERFIKKSKIILLVFSHTSSLAIWKLVCRLID